MDDRPRIGIEDPAADLNYGYGRRDPEHRVGDDVDIDHRRLPLCKPRGRPASFSPLSPGRRATLPMPQAHTWPTTSSRKDAIASVHAVILLLPANSTPDDAQEGMGPRVICTQ